VEKISLHACQEFAWLAWPVIGMVKEARTTRNPSRDTNRSTSHADSSAAAPFDRIWPRVPHGKPLLLSSCSPRAHPSAACLPILDKVYFARQVLENGTFLSGDRKYLDGLGWTFEARKISDKKKRIEIGNSTAI